MNPRAGYGLAETRRLELQYASLEGDLVAPKSAMGLVIFAHGSGSSRFSPRNRWVAKQLQAARLATLLFDLLTAEEHEVDVVTREFRFDIPRLAERMAQAVHWALQQEETRDLPVGLFGASTGAAAALIAAANRPQGVKAIVSRGGRPDLAGEALPRVQAPTLLIVGERDEPVIQLNRTAQAELTAESRLELVPGATHLFEEPGTLERVARLAADWFRSHLARN